MTIRQSKRKKGARSKRYIGLAILGLLLFVLLISTIFGAKNNYFGLAKAGERLLAMTYMIGAPDFSNVVANTTTPDTASSTGSTPTVQTVSAESGPHDVYSAGCEPNGQLSPAVTIISPANGSHLAGGFDVVAKAHMCQSSNHVSPFGTVVFNNNGTTLGSAVPQSRQTYFSYVKCADDPNDWCATVHFVQISPGENTVTISGDAAGGEQARASIKIINDITTSNNTSDTGKAVASVCGGANYGCLSYLSDCSASYINNLEHPLNKSVGVIKFRPGRFVFVRTDPTSWRILHRDYFNITAGQTTRLTFSGCD